MKNAVKNKKNCYHIVCMILRTVVVLMCCYLCALGSKGPAVHR